MKERALKIISSFLFVVFLAGIMPKEYLHDIVSSHDDGVHPIYKKGEMAFTVKHHHCSFLSFEFAPFLAPAQQTIVFEQQPGHTTQYVLPGHYHHYTSPYSVISLRGPPAAGIPG